jgi:hypothetical protein
LLALDVERKQNPTNDKKLCTYKKKKKKKKKTRIETEKRSQFLS